MILTEMNALKIVLVIVFVFLVITIFKLIYDSKTYEEKLICITKAYLEDGKELSKIIDKKDEEIKDLKIVIKEYEAEIGQRENKNER